MTPAIESPLPPAPASPVCAEHARPSCRRCRVVTINGGDLTLVVREPEGTRSPEREP